MKTIFLLFTITLSITLQAFAQDSSPQVQAKLNHIAVAVIDLEESEEFYRDIIGLTQIEEPFGLGMHAWFDIGGGAELHVIAAADERTEHEISSHLCFSVPDMDAFVQKLADNGIPFYDFDENEGEMTLRPDGVHQIYFTDPDGYWVEINDDF